MSPPSPFRQDEIIRKRSRNRRLLLVLAVLLLLAGGAFWYWHDLQKYHVILSFDDAKPIMEPRAAGFLAGGESTPYAFYDWRGTLRWRVEETHRGRYLRAGDVLTETTKRYALSPDGKFLSVIEFVPWAERVELRTWREGKPYRTMTVPVGTVSDLLQMNDGSVFVSGKRQNEAVKSLWVKDARVIAAVADYRLLGIAEDGRTALVSDSTGRILRDAFPCTVSIVNDRIKLRSVLPRFDCCSVHNSGALLFSDGFMHRKGVTKPLARGVPVVRVIGLSGGGGAFDAQGRVVVVSTDTGLSWSIPLKKGYALSKVSAGVSENGRFAAVTYNRDAFLKLRQLYAVFPPLARMLPQRTRQEVLLHAQPGRQIANLSDLLGAQAVSDSPWYPSPDGRAVVGFTIEGDNRYRGMLLRKGR
jgi:hypothetical protein